MSRLGYLCDGDYFDSGVEGICEGCTLPGLDAEGIFTHFAVSDEFGEEYESYTKHQFELFMDVISKLEKRGIRFKIRHCANSAAIIDLPEYKLDMVREGIILYGLKPSDEVDASMKYYPALELKTHVIFVKELGAGESISYGRTFVTDRPMRIATVAIGYADGYPRSLSNKGYVLIHGKKAKVVGRVCMDQMMIDVTDIPDVNVEDVVTVVGKDGSEEITFEEVGELSGRFNYEFVCDISERVERKYV